MTRESEERRMWLALEAVVGLPAVELDDVDDGAPGRADHEPSDDELHALAKNVPVEQVDAVAAFVKAKIEAEWERRLNATAQPPKSRAKLPAAMSVQDLLARRNALVAAHPGLAQFHRELADDQAEDVLRAQVEDMEALAAEMTSPIDDDD